MSAHRIRGRGSGGDCFPHLCEQDLLGTLELSAKDTRLYSPFFEVGFTVRTTFELDRLCRMHTMLAMSMSMSMINTPIARMTACGLQECEPKEKRRERAFHTKCQERSAIRSAIMKGGQRCGGDSEGGPSAASPHTRVHSRLSFWCLALLDDDFFQNRNI